MTGFCSVHLKFDCLCNQSFEFLVSKTGWWLAIVPILCDKFAFFLFTELK